MNLGAYGASAPVPQRTGDAQCRLSLSGSNLLLAPFGGDLLRCPDAPLRIQSEGATLPPTGLANSTLYYIYATAGIGGVALEASTTAYVQADEATGLSVKTGDTSRRLVGMARTTSGGAWADSATQRFVRSRFNSTGIAGINPFTSNQGSITSTASFGEINSAFRCEFLVWSGEIVHLTFCGTAFNGSSGAAVFSAIGIDGTTAEDGGMDGNVASINYEMPFNCSLHKTGLSEGYHYVTALAKVGSGSGTWVGSATAGLRCTVQVRI
jgi:hypothetical protein